MRAKVSPAMIKTVEAKYTSHGIPIAAIEREQEILFEQHKYMDRKIRNMVEFAMQENSNLSNFLLFTKQTPQIISVFFSFYFTRFENKIFCLYNG